jgi:hypothetical protein
MLAARAGEFAIDVLHRTVAAAIDLVVKIDGEHRGIVADINLAAISLVDLDGVGVDDVLPAMVFEVARHDLLLWLCRARHSMTGRMGTSCHVPARRPHEARAL